MFSGSVARGVRQLTSQMNDHRRGEGNRNAEQNSAYDLLLCLFIYLQTDSPFLCFLVKPPDAEADCQKERSQHEIRCRAQNFIHKITEVQKQKRGCDHRQSPGGQHHDAIELAELLAGQLGFFLRHNRFFSSVALIPESVCRITLERKWLHQYS